jgi:outer membrane protein assembly factor BamB
MRNFAGLCPAIWLAFGLATAGAGPALARQPRAPACQDDYAVGYQINSAHDGDINLCSGFSTPLKRLWRVNFRAALTYPVIAGGMVFVNANGTEVNALDIQTGKQVWAKLVSGPLLGPAYYGGNLFILNQGGTLVSYVAGSGVKNWATQLPYEYDFSSSPTAVNGRVYTGGAGDAGYLYAVDAATGNLDWAQFVQNGDDSSAAYGEAGIFVSYPCQYYKFSAVSGKLDWNYDGGCEGGGGNTPVYFNGDVFIQDWTSGNYILDASTGAVIGTFAADLDSTPAFFTSGSEHYGVTLSKGAIYCFNVADSDVAWSFAGDGQLAPSPIVVNGFVVVGSTSGRLYVLDGKTGAVEWSTKTGSAVTSLSAGQGALVVVGKTTISAYAPE